ncbi:hypothetical protein F5B20DRAFT_178856 [Whalleya microplaca]|nr:hypothetical protein F5B20DRAFT_178856 [Whalleya microplaca]
MDIPSRIQPYLVVLEDILGMYLQVFDNPMRVRIGGSTYNPRNRPQDVLQVINDSRRVDALTLFEDFVAHYVREPQPLCVVDFMCRNKRAYIVDVTAGVNRKRSQLTTNMIMRKSGQALPAAADDISSVALRLNSMNLGRPGRGGTGEQTGPYVPVVKPKQNERKREERKTKEKSQVDEEAVK